MAHSEVYNIQSCVCVYVCMCVSVCAYVYTITRQLCKIRRSRDYLSHCIRNIIRVLLQNIKQIVSMSVNSRLIFNILGIGNSTSRQIIAILILPCMIASTSVITNENNKTSSRKAKNEAHGKLIFHKFLIINFLLNN